MTGLAGDAGCIGAGGVPAGSGVGIDDKVCVAQPAIHRASAHAARAGSRVWIFATRSLIMGARTSYSMETLLWLLLEAGVALLLLVLIVWWTWPRDRTGNAARGDGTDREG